MYIVNIRVVAVAVHHELPGDQALSLPLEHGERLARRRTLLNLYKCILEYTIKVHINI